MGGEDEEEEVLAKEEQKQKIEGCYSYGYIKHR